MAERKIRTVHQNRKTNLIMLIILAVMTVFPLVIKNSLMLSVGCYILLYSMVSMSNMITIGYGGMMNLGQAAFYGIGAYTSALLSLRLGLPFIVCFFAAGIVAAVFGFLISVPCLRVRADFLGLITLAFLQLFVSLAQNWVSLTRGPMGLTNIPDAKLFGFAFSSQTSFFYLALTITTFSYIILRRLMRSPSGRAIQSVRDDEIGARSVGINVNYYKIYAFTVGAFFAGIAGSLYVSYVGFIGSSTFTLETSFLLLEMNILGGLGSLEGALFGAAFLTILPEIIRPLAAYRVGVGGLLMLLVVLLRPQGVFGSRAFAGNGGILAGRFDRIKKRWNQRAAAKAASSQNGKEGA